jgi:uncharacterized membrane protein YgcG
MGKGIGDKIQLANQEVEVVACEKCSKPMVNLDADNLSKGDLTTLKKAGVTVSNPETKENVCVHCEYQPTIGHKIAQFFESKDDDDDDSHLFGSSGGFLGGLSSGGFGGGFSGGFGGFGGGGFAGGGASASF